MDVLHLDLDKAKFLVDQSIKQRGETYVYEKDQGLFCTYVHDTSTWDDDAEDYVTDYECGTPGCLVGLALIKGGVPQDGFKGVNQEGSYSALAALRDRGYLTYDEAAADYLANLQQMQDDGLPWGEARKRAETIARTGTDDLLYT